MEPADITRFEIAKLIAMCLPIILGGLLFLLA
jgi:hypothetical protein